MSGWGYRFRLLAASARVTRFGEGLGPGWLRGSSALPVRLPASAAPVSG